MDTQRFSEAYPPLQEKVTPSNPERRELLETPRQWMSFFNETLQNILTDQPVPDREVFHQQLLEYWDWSRRYLEPINKRLHAIHDPETAGHVTSELNFHAINTGVAELWEAALYDDPLPEKRLIDMQTYLAIEVAPKVQQLRQLVHRNEPNDHTDLKSTTGFVTEVDSAITFLELMKQNPAIVVLPAPLQFEANVLARSPDGLSRNSDFIAIDRSQNHARGIQVKSGHGTIRYFLHYDPDYVTMISGSTDLGNTRFQSNSREVFPGLIALGFLAQQDIKTQPVTHYRQDFLKSRTVAREILRTTKPFLTQAVSNIGGRILRELYLDAPIEKDQSPKQLVS